MPMPARLLVLAIAIAAVAFAAFATHSQIYAECDRINPDDTYSPCKEDIVVRVETRMEYPHCVQEVVVDGLTPDYQWGYVHATARQHGRTWQEAQWDYPGRTYFVKRNLGDTPSDLNKGLTRYEGYDSRSGINWGNNPAPYRVSIHKAGEGFSVLVDPHETWASQTVLTLSWQGCIRKLQAETRDRQENASRLDALRTAYSGLREEFPESEEIAKRLHAIEYQKGLTEIEIAVYEVRILGADDADTRAELRRILSRAQARLAQLTQAETRLLAQQAGQEDILRMLSAIQGRIEAFQSRFGSIALDPLPGN